MHNRLQRFCKGRWLRLLRWACLLGHSAFPFRVFFAVLFVSLLRMSRGVASGFPPSCLITSPTVLQHLLNLCGTKGRLYRPDCSVTFVVTRFVFCLLVTIFSLPVLQDIHLSSTCHTQLCLVSVPILNLVHHIFLHQPVVSLHLDVHPPLNIPPLFKLRYHRPEIMFAFWVC